MTHGISVCFGVPVKVQLKPTDDSTSDKEEMQTRNIWRCHNKLAENYECHVLIIEALKYWEKEHLALSQQTRKLWVSCFDHWSQLEWKYQIWELTLRQNIHVFTCVNFQFNRKQNQYFEFNANITEPNCSFGQKYPYRETQDNLKIWYWDWVMMRPGIIWDPTTMPKETGRTLLWLSGGK